MSQSTRPRSPRFTAQTRRRAQASTRAYKPPAGDPSTCDVEYTPEQLELLRAMDRYQRETGRRFPNYCEVLDVIKSLGYVKAG